MEWEKIVKWLLIAELVFISFVVLYTLRVALAQTIGIGVSPAVLKYNFPAVYSYEFCFFNQGDTDAVYAIQSGDIRVLNEMNFTVPANTNYDNCVKKTLQLVVDKPGYFYVLAYPNMNQSSTISIVRRVGVKVELNHLPTTTTISQSSSGSSPSVQTTTATINQTFSNVSNVNATTITTNFTSSASVENATNSTNVVNQTSEGSGSNIDFLDISIKVIVFLVLIIVAYYVYQNI